MFKKTFQSQDIELENFTKQKNLHSGEQDALLVHLERKQVEDE
jgi:hypothetical protein